MSNRALLIGSGLDGLVGVDTDIAVMRDALTTRGFAIETCVGEQATRAGIIAAYEQLIESTQPGDAVVVYYSGHGGRVAAPDSGEPGPDPMDMQFIAPVDYHQTSPGDFRAITSVELSVLLGRLTERTDNATVVLDCCHAANMSRDESMRVKALKHLAPYERVRDHIDRQPGLRTVLRTPLGNPDAVRIVACAPEQSAFEYRGRAGREIGLLTESLGMALAEAGSQEVTWATVMDRVRERVLLLAPNQRPWVEGPSRRILFSTKEDDHLTTLRVIPAGADRVRLQCAALLGVRVGDEFMVMPPDAPAVDADRKIGDVRVTGVGSLEAAGSIVFSPGWTEVPFGSRAFRITAAAPALPVHVPEDAAHVVQAVSAEPLLQPVGRDAEWPAEVRIDPSGELTVHDRIGPLHAPVPADGKGLAQVLDNLKILAQATAVRGLSATTEWALNAAVTIEWGRVLDGRRYPLARSGSVVHVGDNIYLSVRNDSTSDIYVSLVDIGVSGRIAVLTRFAPEGVHLAPGKIYELGFDDLAGVPVGARLTWPDRMDPAQARPETVLVLAMSARQDVIALEQDGVRGPQAKGGNRSPLEGMLDQIATGRSREVTPVSTATARYDVHAVDFELDPIPDEGTFLIDERPSPATRALTVRALTVRGPVPSKVAVRIEKLRIHRNRAWFGADIRVDTVVVTGSGSGQPAYHARTERFSNIDDEELLPVDKLLLYYGPAIDYIDIAVWVSRDEKDSLALSDLLTDKLTDAEIQHALAGLAGVAVAAPQAAAAAALIGAGAVVVNVAYRLLRGVVGTAIGLYRGSRLAYEQFGVGRHPEHGSLRVQDFSIAFSIEDVSVDARDE